MVKESKFRKFMLTHQQLSDCKERGNSVDENLSGFLEDLSKNLLDEYTGGFVAYQKGVLVGADFEKDRLYDEATGYFGASSLAVFPVNPSRNLDLNQVRGRFSSIGKRNP